MKKQMSHIVSIVLSLILLFPFSTSLAYAEDSDDYELLRDEYCSHCGYPVNLVCAGDAHEYGQSSHSYLGQTCTVVYMNSRGKWVCSECGIWTWQKNNSGSIIWHDCWQVHRKCPKGFYKVCTISM